MLVIVKGPSGSGKTKLILEIAQSLEANGAWKGIIWAKEGVESTAINPAKTSWGLGKGDVGYFVNMARVRCPFTYSELMDSGHHGCL